MVMSAVFVQPFEASVPVTVQVAAEVKSLVVEVDDPSDHVYESAPLAVTLISVLSQVTVVADDVSLFVITTVGLVTSSVMVISAVDVHPFAKEPVTVYVPAVVRSLEADVEEPSDHVQESAPLAVTLIAPFTQVISVAEDVSVLLTEVTDVLAQSIKVVVTGSE